MIPQRRRNDREFPRLVLAQEVDRLFRHLGIDRRFALESGQQFPHRPRIQQRSRQAMLPHLPRFLENVDVLFRHLRVRMVPVVLVNKLREPQRACHSRRASADNHNIGLHLRAVDSFQGFAKSDHRRPTILQGTRERPTAGLPKRPVA